MLFAARTGQLAGERILDPTLSGFIGAAVVVPVADLVARAANADAGSENFLSALVSVASIALGILVGTMAVWAVKALGAGSRSPG